MLLPRWLPSRFGLGLAVCVVGSCHSADKAQTAAQSWDSAGVRIVESNREVWGPGEQWTVSPTPDVSIGAVDGDDAYVFHRIRHVRLLENGSFLVADGGSQELRWFDSAGHHLTTRGGPGRGPGEFVQLGGFAESGDTVWASDGAQRRVSLFDGSGASLGSIPMEPTGRPGHPLRLYRLGGISQVGLIMVVRSFPANMQPEPMVHWDSVPTLRYGRDGGMIGEIGEHGGMDIYASPERAQGVLFGRISSSFIQGEDLYMTDGGAFEIRVYNAGGLRAVYRILRDPRRVTDRMIQEVPEFFADGPHRDTLPWVSGIVVDDLGYVWAGVYGDPSDDAPPKWSIFHPKGHWLGDVEMPERFTPFQINHRSVIGVYRDDNQVESVRVFSLHRDHLP
jgi:hypothetical protein